MGKQSRGYGYGGDDDLACGRCGRVRRPGTVNEKRDGTYGKGRRCLVGGEESKVLSRNEIRVDLGSFCNPGSLQGTSVEKK